MNDDGGLFSLMPSFLFDFHCFIMFFGMGYDFFIDY